MTRWRDKDAAESTVTDRGRDRRRDRGEVAQGAEATIGRHPCDGSAHTSRICGERTGDGRGRNWSKIEEPERKGATRQGSDANEEQSRA